MPASLKLLDIQPVTHDVKRYTLERPADWHFVPGQATELILDRDGWRDQGRHSPSPRCLMPNHSSSPSKATAIMTA